MSGLYAYSLWSLASPYILGVVFLDLRNFLCKGGHKTGYCCVPHCGWISGNLIASSQSLGWGICWVSSYSSALTLLVQCPEWQWTCPCLQGDAKSLPVRNRNGCSGYLSGSVEAAACPVSIRIMLHRSICRAFARGCGRDLLPHCTFGVICAYTYVCNRHLRMIFSVMDMAFFTQWQVTIFYTFQIICLYVLNALTTTTNTSNQVSTTMHEWHNAIHTCIIYTTQTTIL